MTDQRKQWYKDEAMRMISKLASRMPIDAAKKAAVYLADQNIKEWKSILWHERTASMWENVKRELELIEV